MTITDITAIASLAITGAAVSVLVQFFKRLDAKVSHWMVVGLLIVLSIGAGTAYSQLKDTSLAPTIIQIVLYANAVYGLLIKAFEA